jgi:hypothetical protein
MCLVSAFSQVAVQARHGMDMGEAAGSRQRGAGFVARQRGGSACTSDITSLPQRYQSVVTGVYRGVASQWRLSAMQAGRGFDYSCCSDALCLWRVISSAAALLSAMRPSL